MAMEGSLPGSNWQCYISGLHNLPVTHAFGAARGRSYEENISRSRYGTSIEGLVIAIDEA